MGHLPAFTVVLQVYYKEKRLGPCGQRSCEECVSCPLTESGNCRITSLTGLLVPPISSADLNVSACESAAPPVVSSGNRVIMTSITSLRCYYLPRQ